LQSFVIVNKIYNIIVIYPIRSSIYVVDRDIAFRHKIPKDVVTIVVLLPCVILDEIKFLLSCMTSDVLPSNLNLRNAFLRFVFFNINGDSVKRVTLADSEINFVPDIWRCISLSSESVPSYVHSLNVSFHVELVLFITQFGTPPKLVCSRPIIVPSVPLVDRSVAHS
jgi:hypothetical protein